MIKRIFILLILLFISFAFSQNLKTEGKKIVDENGNEVGYGNGDLNH